MSNPIVRPIPIYVNKDKVAEATEGTFEINGAVTLAICADSVGVNRGRPTVSCNFKTIVPVKGERVKAMKMCAAQLDIEVEIFAGGDMFKSAGAFDGASMQWDEAAGKATGDAKFIGGPATIT